MNLPRIRGLFEGRGFHPEGASALTVPGRKINRFWISSHPGLEAWSSAWSGGVQPRHSHDCYQVSMARTGEGAFVHRDRPYHCALDRVILIGPGEVHEVVPRASAAWEFDTLYLSDEAIRCLGSESRAIGADAIGMANPGLSARFARLHRAIVDRAPLIEQEERLLGFAESLRDGLGEGLGGRMLASPGRGALDRVRDYLDACPDSGISLIELADLAGLSPSHLSRSFRREFGLPPYAYLMQARIRRSRSLLRQGRPVVEVAASTGFADQAHLTRIFRRLVGVTPGRYLAEGRIVQDPSGRSPYPDQGH